MARRKRKLSPGELSSDKRPRTDVNKGKDQELQRPSSSGKGTSNQRPLTESEQEQNSCSRNPLHQIKNNNNNHIIDSVSSTVILGQNIEDVPIISHGQEEAVPLRYQSQAFHRRLLKMKVYLNPCHDYNDWWEMGFANPCLQNRLAKAFTYTKPRKRHSCSRLSFHQEQFQAFRFLQLHLQRALETNLPFPDILNATWIRSVYSIVANRQRFYVHYQVFTMHTIGCFHLFYPIHPQR